MTKSGENAMVRRRDGGDGEVIHERERGGVMRKKKKHIPHFLLLKKAVFYIF